MCSFGQSYKNGTQVTSFGPTSHQSIALIAEQRRDPGTNHWYHHTSAHHYELFGKYQGSNSPLPRNMRENQKSLFLQKPGHTCLEGHQSAMKGPGQVLCLDLFSPDFIDCVKAMPPGDRVCGVSWVEQSDACPKIKIPSLASSRVVATITNCCCCHR